KSAVESTNLEPEDSSTSRDVRSSYGVGPLENDAHSHFTLLPRLRSQDAAERIRAHVCNVLAAESPKIVPAQHVEHLSDQFDPRAPTRNDRLADSEVALTQPVVVNLALRNWREIQGGAVRVDRRQHGSAVAVAHVFRRPGHVVCGVVAAYTSAATRALPISIQIDSSPGAERRRRSKVPDGPNDDVGG